MIYYICAVFSKDTSPGSTASGYTPPVYVPPPNTPYVPVSFKKINSDTIKFFSTSSSREKSIVQVICSKFNYGYNIVVFKYSEEYNLNKFKECFGNMHPQLNVVSMSEIEVYDAKDAIPVKVVCFN